MAITPLWVGITKPTADLQAGLWLKTNQMVRSQFKVAANIQL